jgi:hypothetical protein
MMDIEHVSETLGFFNQNKISDSVQYLCQFNNTPSSQNFKFNCSVGYKTVEFVVLMKSPVFWDITLFSTLKVKRRFGVTCRLHLRRRRISRARNHHEAGGKATRSSETSIDFKGLHGVISTKMLLFVQLCIYYHSYLNLSRSQ